MEASEVKIHDYNSRTRTVFAVQFFFLGLLMLSHRQTHLELEDSNLCLDKLTSEQGK